MEEVGYADLRRMMAALRDVKPGQQHHIPNWSPHELTGLGEDNEDEDDYRSRPTLLGTYSDRVNAKR